MSNKCFRNLIAFAAISGIVAAGVSYFLKYKSFHHELEEDFHDFEANDKTAPSDTTSSGNMKADRSYISIDADKLAHDMQCLNSEISESISEIGHTLDENKKAMTENIAKVKEATTEVVKDAGKAMTNTFSATKETVTDFIETAAESISKTMPFDDLPSESTTTIIEEDTQD